MKALLFLILILIVTNGCASIMAPRQTLTVQTEPAEARVIINGTIYQSPCRADVERFEAHWKHHQVKVEKDGYRPCKYETSKDANPWFFGNFVMVIPVFVGVGMLIDFFSGSGGAEEPQDARIVLNKDKECEVWSQNFKNEWVLWRPPRNRKTTAE